MGSASASSKASSTGSLEASAMGGSLHGRGRGLGGLGGLGLRRGTLVATAVPSKGRQPKASNLLFNAHSRASSSSGCPQSSPRSRTSSSASSCAWITLSSKDGKGLGEGISEEWIGGTGLARRRTRRRRARRRARRRRARRRTRRRARQRARRRARRCEGLGKELGSVPRSLGSAKGSAEGPAKSSARCPGFVEPKWLRIETLLHVRAVRQGRQTRPETTGNPTPKTNRNSGTLPRPPLAGPRGPGPYQSLECPDEHRGCDVFHSDAARHRHREVSADRNTTTETLILK